MARFIATTLNQEMDPLAPLEHVFQGLVDLAIHTLIGALLGLFAARLMRRRHLHWSWAAGAFALVLIARSALAGLAGPLAAATLAAAVRGRRWQREDLQAGADLAEIAARRTTLLDGLHDGAHGVLSWLVSRGLARKRSGSARWTRGEELSVGCSDRGRPVAIELGGAGGGSGGGTHALVTGATGSGKTVTQTWITVRAIELGLGSIVIDPKHDPWMRERLGCAAAAAGRRFIVWTPEGPTVYNPFARGSETEIADKALAGERFTEPHYQRQAQRYLGHAVRALRANGEQVSLRRLVEMLDPMALELLARDLEQERATTVHAYLDALTPRQRSDLTGVRDRLAIMVESDVGPWLDPTTVKAESFDLLDAVRTGAVVYFSLQADSRPLLAQMLGSAIVQDLQTVVSALQERPVPCVVVIDEFSAIAAEHVARLFGRARSAGINLLLGTQELSDLRLPGREHLLEQVLGNLTSLIGHRQVVPESAELVARLAGSRGAWRTTVSSDGRHTRTRVSGHLVSPEEVMSLPWGCAAVIRLSGRRGATVARMHAPE
jgi:type IV secretory pathway TraG/TraD family ATPase VirD4